MVTTKHHRADHQPYKFIDPTVKTGRLINGGKSFRDFTKLSGQTCFDNYP